uniref:(California timema) hypothetical protein n=1 Tax=Timema californicum TaxID=61474 RepID=A0A7R9J0S6_TIMCA|nr:unnamed protein product [Timema californicum]
MHSTNSLPYFPFSWRLLPVIIIIIIVLNIIGHGSTYLIIITEDDPPGEVVFNASLPTLGRARHYKINTHRSASFVHHILHVDASDGRVMLKQKLDCDGIYYPNLFTLYVDSVSNQSQGVDYYSLPLRIFVSGKRCDGDKNAEATYKDNRIHLKVSEAKRWISETFASYAIPSTDGWNQICLRKSQFVNSISSFLPLTVRKVCQIRYLDSSDPRFQIESHAGDLVSAADQYSRSQGMFSIEPNSGVVSTLTSLDRELVDVHYFRVTAMDDSFPPRSGTTTLQINVLDANDHAPVFESNEYEASIRESVTVGSTVVTLKATDQDIGQHAEVSMGTRHCVMLCFQGVTWWSRDKASDFCAGGPGLNPRALDADQGNNAAVRYAIIGGNTQSQFSIDSLSGEVALVKPLDYEMNRNYRLVIRAQDGGSPSRSNTTQLLINVKDVNDNAPRFYTSLFQESVLESVPTGFSIVRVQAYDADEGDNAAISYSLGPRDEGGGSTSELPVTVDEKTGWIYTTRELDREEQARYQFTVNAKDNGKPPKSATASVVITVQDVNDNDPVFEPNIYEAVVAEDDPPGTPVTTVTATDKDENPRLHYELSGGNVRGRFAVTSQNGHGLITIAQPLDYKQEKRFILTVTATDSGGLHDTATVYVNVSDANNFAPVFENAPYSASVFEDAPIGTTVLVVGATDSDVGQNAQITYSLGTMDDKSTTPEFTINPQTGAILTTKKLDRETVGGYLLTITAKDGGIPPLSDTTDVEITVADVNDNAPVFKKLSYLGSIPEDALVGTSVLHISATDADMGLNGRIRYALAADTTSDAAFVVDPTSGVIRTSKTLDRESVANYELTAYAIDRGSPSLSGSVQVLIRIEDVNDSPPAFESDKIVMYIAENSPVGSTVGEIYAHDPDEGPNAVVQYSIIGGDDSNSFSLITRPGSNKAELLTMQDLDYESSHKKYDLVVRAASPPLRSDTHVEILVTDVNDNAPVLKDFQVIFNNFRDCFPAGAVGRIPAFDADVSDQLRYRVLSGNNANLIHLNESSGEISLSPQLNTNVPKVATMEVSVTDGVNEVKAIMQLTVRLVTEEMLFNSITVRLNDMTEEAFLSPLLTFFIDGLAAIIPCPKENIFVFSVQDDTDVNAKILNVSFSARRPDLTGDEFYPPQFLQERVYLNRAILARLSTVQVLPFDDNLCVREPCLNYEECLTVLKFGNASTGFISSDTVLFRPIYPVTTFACRCPRGFTGSREPYLCDTEVNLCYSNPCGHNGNCHRSEGGYSCVCKPGFTGVNCELDLHLDTCQPGICRSNSLCSPLIKGGFVCENCSPTGGVEHYTKLCELRSRSFSKESFLTFPALRQRHRVHIKLRFATQSESGLLLYNGRYNEKHDFIALEIVSGAIHFSFSLGSNVTTTVASLPGGVSDGSWHSVTVHYFNKSAVVSLDECDTLLATKYGPHLGAEWSCANHTTQILENRCAIFTETCHRFLDLTGPLQIGGLPSLPTSFQVHSKDFIGCISDLYIDNKFIDLNSYVADNGTISGCPEKKAFCLSSPCNHGAKCVEGWGTYLCECNEGWSGKNCSLAVKLPWRFQGDGVLSFNPLLRPIQLPWLNALSVRTLQKDAFLMSIQIGQNSSAVLSLGLCVSSCVLRACTAGALCLFMCSSCLYSWGFVSVHVFFVLVQLGLCVCTCVLRACTAGALCLYMCSSCLYSWGFVSLHVFFVLLVNGEMNYSFNSEVVTLPNGYLSDGKWHHVEIKWMSGEVWINLDYGQREVTEPASSKLQGHYVGKILIGGPDSSVGSLTADYGYFEGCIQDVRVGTPQSSLTRPTVKENVVEGCIGVDQCSHNDKCPKHSKCINEWEQFHCRCDTADCWTKMANEKQVSMASEQTHAAAEEIVTLTSSSVSTLCAKLTRRDDVWCVDSGATTHMCRDKNSFLELTPTISYVGSSCVDVCEVNPCSNDGRCIVNPSSVRGYSCHCDSNEFSGEYCDVKVDQPCPSSWWGYPVCGPCHCDVDKGYNADCNKTTGECYCKENHYQPVDSDHCYDCECYATGSYSNQCDLLTGQCKCRNGVIGRRCDSCPNPYAEVTLRGCEVVYDGCPRSFSCGLWWERTPFGKVALESCPNHSQGRASRSCDEELGGWQEPDLTSNWAVVGNQTCSYASLLYLEERAGELGQLEGGDLHVTTFVAVKVAADLRRATNKTEELHGSDVLISQQLLQELMSFEGGEKGLNLTHSQDKDYIQNIVAASSVVLSDKYTEHWERIEELTGETAEDLVLSVDKYIATLAKSQEDTYTNPFEIVADNMALGLDVVTPESLFGYETTTKDLAGILSLPGERVVIPDTSQFLQPSIELPSSSALGSGPHEDLFEAVPALVFPKYNNYLLDRDKFDVYSKILVPLNLLGIKPLKQGELTTKHSLVRNRRAVLSYAQYRTAGLLLPQRYDETVKRRWGVDLRVGSPLVSLAILVTDEEDTQPGLYSLSKDTQQGLYSLSKDTQQGLYSLSEDTQQGLYSLSKDTQQGLYSLSKDTQVALYSLSKDTQLGLYSLSEDTQQGLYSLSEDTQQDWYSLSEDTQPGLYSLSKDTQQGLYSLSEDTQQDLYSLSEDTQPGLYSLSKDTQPGLYSLSKDTQQVDSSHHYKLLTDSGSLPSPVILRLWLDPESQPLSPRLNPQCVHWSMDRGIGEWSRSGCQTEVPNDWEVTVTSPFLVNCTCIHLSTFAVLVDLVDLDYIPDPSLTEDVTTYAAFCLALPMLLVTLLILTFIRGVETNSNSIHKNMVLCIFLAELLFFVALKARRYLTQREFPCKMLAMCLHYMWLSAFSWSLVDSVHLYRMLTEMRDINHGQMRFYYTVGYGLPAVVVGLAVGVRADQYGNFYFCWLSLYESVVWSLIGPVCVAVFFNLAVLLFSIRAAFTLKEHVMGFGNLRTLLWLSVVSLPLLGITWVLAMLSGSEGLPLLWYLVCLAVLTHAFFSLIGYCFLNTRVRRNLKLSLLRCLGKKVPPLETSEVTGSSQGAAPAVGRSALAYRSNEFEARRHVGISTSSTTSRSTTKTSSSPYRSDTQLRQTTTSSGTSNYNSTSDMPSYVRGMDTSLHRHREIVEESPTRARRPESDSDSEASVDRRSLELASSHSSDDDESSNRRRHRDIDCDCQYVALTDLCVGGDPGVDVWIPDDVCLCDLCVGGVSVMGAPSYLPNICEDPNVGHHGGSGRGPQIQPPPSLNIINNSQLFPNLKPIYAPRWSSQLPEAYLPSNMREPSLRGSQWSGTASDNETSPKALPESQSQGTMTVHHHKMVASQENFHDLADHCSEIEEKIHLGDKYLFPYTAEEDHCGTAGFILPMSGRILTTGDLGSARASPSLLHAAPIPTPAYAPTNISDSE